MTSIVPGMINFRNQVADVAGFEESKVEETLNSILSELFPPGTNELNPDQLVPTLTRRTEGMSDVDVVGISFAAHRPDPEVVSEIVVRVHQNEDAAEKEFNLVDSFVRNSSSVFSKSPKRIPDRKSMIIYTHADRALGETSTNLASRVVEKISSATAEQFSNFCEMLQRDLGKARTDLSNFLAHPESLMRTELLESIEKRVAPALFIEASGIDFHPDGSFPLIIIHDLEGATRNAADVARVDEWDPRQNQSGRWVRTTVLFDSSSSNILRFRLPRTEAGDWCWILTEDRNVSSQVKGIKDAITLMFKLQESVVQNWSARLDIAGFSDDQQWSISEIASRIPETCATSFQHRDLHQGNILCSEHGLHIIDLGGLGVAPEGSDWARLELSLWRTVAAKIDVRPDSVPKLTWGFRGSCSQDSNIGQDLNSDERRFLEVLNAIRNALVPTGIHEDALMASLLSQLLMAQRFEVESGAEASPSFAALCGEFKARLAVNSEQTPMFDLDNTPESSLLNLWRRALEKDDYLSEMAAHFLQGLSKLCERTMTDLQMSAYAVGNDLFETNKHVIISGPTSSGKTTIADMLMTRTVLLGNQRARALYIAPTKALAHAKYHEFVRMFQHQEEFHDQIKIVTGDEAKDRSSVVRGRFKIACMVYESANIVFSESGAFLDKLGCIVVDELHMIQDLHRGPLLEIAVTKAIAHRNQSAPAHEQLRIIGITTESSTTSKAFLTIRADSFDYPPVVVDSLTRPVEVRHSFVFRESPDGEKYPKLNIKTFKGDEPRLLGDKEYRAVDALTIGYQHDSHYGSARADVDDTLINTLRNALKEHPFGYRALVFVPSRARANNIGKRLSDELARITISDGTLSWGDRYGPLVIRLARAFSGVEPTNRSHALQEFAKYGILMHHSDIKAHVRREVEMIAAEKDSTAPSQVLIATETLSYGMNLAISDVYMLGTTFTDSKRDGNREQRLLDPCDFHNMAGRAGRLGQLDSGIANVFIVLPRANNPRAITDHYYRPPQPTLGSQLFHAYDQRIISNAKRKQTLDPNFVASVSALELSDPFVKSMLDSLRHLSITRTGNPDAKSLDAIHDFLNDTMFVSNLLNNSTLHQNDSKVVYAHLKDAIRNTLESCSSIDLRLVTKVEAEAPHGVNDSNSANAKYYITERGQAVVDTGTKLKTLQPLVNMASQISRLQLPVEAFAIALVAQEEIYQEYTDYLPEYNRDNNFRDELLLSTVINKTKKIFRSVTAEFGITSEEADKLIGVLEEAEHLSGDDRDSKIRRNALLRLASALLMWINGLDEDSILNLLEGRGSALPPDAGLKPGEMMGFAQFTEALGWKAVLIARILPLEGDDTIQLPSHVVRDLTLLANRIKFGSSANSLPYFLSAGPQDQQPVSRPFIRELEKAGIRPVVVLSPSHVGGASIEAGAPNEFALVRERLGKFAVQQYESLADEMTRETDENDSARGVVDDFWDGSGAAFASSKDAFLTPGISRGLEQPWSLFSKLPTDISWLLSQVQHSVYRVGIVQVNRLIGDAEVPQICLVDESRERTLAGLSEADWQAGNEVFIVAIEIKEDWQMSATGRNWTNLAQFIESQGHVNHLGIVAFPWWPDLNEIPDQVRIALAHRAAANMTTTLLTPASLSLVLSLLARDLLVDRGRTVMSELVEPGEEVTYKLVNVEMLTKYLKREVPTILRETLLSHFEVN